MTGRCITRLLTSILQKSQVLPPRVSSVAGNRVHQQIERRSLRRGVGSIQLLTRFVLSILWYNWLQQAIGQLESSFASRATSRRKFAVDRLPEMACVSGSRPLCSIRAMVMSSPVNIRDDVEGARKLTGRGRVEGGG